MDRKNAMLHIYNLYAEENAPGDDALIHRIGQAVQSLADFLEAETVVWGNVPPVWGEVARG
ncbi:MAG TPA: hypothetical protein EYP41_21440 [Anaerolineae bacterium]|nr:hypothetical protein [Anaerolineae bacterium]HIP74021.1 hypothetical protein [Anaerolineae bacterium]